MSEKQLSVKPMTSPGDENVPARTVLISPRCVKPRGDVRFDILLDT